MECVRVKELLSEYIDDTLDQETRKTVEKHLSSCEGCAEELASLRSLVEELGSLEKVKPPADFLEQLHERLESPSGFTRIGRKLFVPFHVKIPLELATATLLAVLVFSLFHTQLTEKPMIQTPLEQKAMEATEIETAKKKEVSLKKRPGAPKAAFEAPSRVIKGGEMDVSKPDAGIHQSLELTLLVKKRVKKSVRGRVYRKPMALRDTRTAEKESAADEERPYQASSGAAAEPSFTDQLKHLIEKEGGRVLSVEYNSKTGLPTTIQAEIPTNRYQTLYNQLKEMASSLESAPPSPQEGQEKISLQIKLLYSE
jgi:hypothetical protein